MKERKTGVRKPRNQHNWGSQPPHTPQIGIPWGRATSEHRPGLFTRQYLNEHGESCAADVFYALRENLNRINRSRIEIGEKPIRGCTYNSFAKYWHWFKLLKLIEPADRRERPIYAFLEEKEFYRLTDKGKAEERAWEDPIAIAHPEFR